MKRVLAGNSYALSALLFAAVLVQAGFWYLATPGPALSGVPRSLPTALTAIGWSLVCLGLVPYVLARLARFSLASLGIALGNWRAGLYTVLIGAVVVAPFLYFGATNPAIQATYPWPGVWLNSAGRFALWAGLYVWYYAAFEFFYRGFMLAVASRTFGPTAGLWFQALAATLIHAGKPLPEFMLALPASLVFGVIAVRTKSLVWPILLHLAIGLLTDASVVLRVGGG